MPRYEESECERVGCTERAKYEHKGEALCGRHCSKKCTGRVTLDTSHYEEYKESFRSLRRAAVEARTLSNKATGKEGTVTVTGQKLKDGKTRVIMLSFPSYRGTFYSEGSLAVFPNFKHGSTPEGYGCADLSPKAMGPIDHGMPGLPVALNIENYHQFAKVFPLDADEDRNPTPAWKLQRKTAYADPAPHRHSPSARKDSKGNRNVPLYSVYYHLETGKERRYTYVECRYFYCHWYAKIAVKLKQYAELKDLVKSGTDLQIVGYDGYYEGVTESLYDHYLDGTRPFGHELVLYSLLVTADPANYPWEIYRRKHADIYDGMFC